MDIRLQTYYENRIAMMSSDAWKDLMEDVQTMLDATNTLDGTNKDNVDLKKGEVSIMRWMLSLKDISAEAFQQLKDEEN